MGQIVQVAPIDAVVGGNEVKTTATAFVELRDATTGYNGPGHYTIQLNHGLSAIRKFVVTVGIPPNDSSTLMTVARVTVTPNGLLIFKDARKLNVGMTGVNETILQNQNGDGSWLASGSVTPRTIAGGVTALLDSIGTTQGDILYRNATEWVVLSPGTAGYVLATGGASANPSWVPGTGPASVADETIESNISGSSAAPSANTLTDILDYILGSTRGAIIERGASGWTLIAPGAAGKVLTSGGSGADPSWATPPSSAVLPMTNGDTPPTLMYLPDGSLLYYPL